MTAPRIQTQLKIGQPNDKYEQEADRVAHEVMGLSESQVDRGGLFRGISLSLSSRGERVPQLQRLCQECQEEERLQPKAAISSNQNSLLQLSSSTPLIKERGQPMPQAMRTFFDPRFGLAFDGVRIHTNSQANAVAESVNARAFTLGQDIVFGAGEYQPHSSGGKQLIAHELTHVAQQNGMTGNGLPTPVIQREDGPSVPGNSELPNECNLDILRLIRLIRGERDVKTALRVIRCCVDVPSLGRGCSDQAVKAACKLFPNLCGSRGTSGTQIQCPPGFRPGKSSDFQGKCCRGKVVIESDRDCCLPRQIAVNAINPRCCPPSQMPNGARTDCVNLPPMPISPIPVPQPSTPPSIPRLSPITTFFFFNSTIRRPESNANFDRVLFLLQNIPRLQVQLIGHASTEGSEGFNLRLGQRRADAMATQLVLQGIDSSRIETLSLGESAPAIPEPTEKGRALLPGLEEIRNQNRRVEAIFIDPEGEFAPSTPTLTLRDPELRLPPIPRFPSLFNP